MELISTVTVDAPVDRTWAAVTDLPRVASCLSGSARRVPHDGRGGDDRTTVLWHSPLSARVVERDDDAHRMVLRVEGDAQATVRVALHPQGAGTRIGIETDLTLGGAAARTGRGVIAGAVAKLVAQGAQRLEAELRAAAPTAATARPADAGTATSSPTGAVPATAPITATTATGAPAAVDSSDRSPARTVAGLPRAVPALGALVALLLGWRLARRRITPA